MMPPDWGFLVGFVVLAAVVAFLVLGFFSRRAQQQRWRELEQIANVFLQEAIEDKRFKAIAVTAMLKRGEEGYYQEQARLYEPRAVRHYSGHSTSMRIMKGVSIRSSRGRSYSTAEWQMLDAGRLIITNKRIIFEGSTEHRSLDVLKMDGVTLFTDGIRVSMSNRRKPLTFTVPNPWLLAGMLAVLQEPERYLGAGSKPALEAGTGSV